MRTRDIGWSVRALCLALLAGAGCYHQQFNNVPVEQPATGAYKLGVVEFDELGWLWDAKQPQEALRLVDEARDTPGRGTAVMVFVHGWHHNAQPDDQNLQCFRETLRRTSDRLNADHVRVALGQRGSAGKPINVVGIYIGWRGEEYPSWLGLLKKVTFWSRKEAGNRVGRGNFRGFLQELDRRYQQSQADSAFFSLVTVGHSFGGQVVFRAVEAIFESQLVEASGNRAWAALTGSPAPSDTARHLIRGVGDAVVLVNPAVEASAYEPLHRLAMGINYSPLQTPVLVTFSAENDGARKKAFPIGRGIGSVGDKRRNAEQAEMDIRSFGVYEPQLTHKLDWTAGPNRKKRKAKEGCTLTGDEDAIPRGQNTWADQLKGDAAGTDLTAQGSIAGSTLSVIPANAKSYRPLVTAKTDDKVIDDHNGFFSYAFVEFLMGYIIDIQMKRELTKGRRLAALVNVTR